MKRRSLKWLVAALAPLLTGPALAAASGAGACQLDLHKAARFAEAHQGECERAAAEAPTSVARGRALIGAALVAHKRGRYAAAASLAEEAGRALDAAGTGDAGKRQLLTPIPIATRALAALAQGDRGTAAREAERLLRTAALDPDAVMLAWQLLTASGRADLAAVARDRYRLLVPNPLAVYHDLLSRLAAGNGKDALASARWLGAIGLPNREEAPSFVRAAFIDGGGGALVLGALTDERLEQLRGGRASFEQRLAEARALKPPSVGERLKGGWTHPNDIVANVEAQLIVWKRGFARTLATRAMALQATGDAAGAAPLIAEARALVPDDPWVLAAATRAERMPAPPTLASLLSTQIAAALRNERYAAFSDPRPAGGDAAQQLSPLLLRLAEPAFGDGSAPDEAWQSGVRIRDVGDGMPLFVAGSDGGHDQRALKLRLQAEVCRVAAEFAAPALAVVATQSQYYKKDSGFGAMLGASLMAALGGTDGDPVEYVVDDPWRRNERFGDDRGRPKRVILALRFYREVVPGTIPVVELGCGELPG
jgi:hypothetical protein